MADLGHCNLGKFTSFTRIKCHFRGFCNSKSTVWGEAVNESIPRQSNRRTMRIPPAKPSPYPDSSPLGSSPAQPEFQLAPGKVNVGKGVNASWSGSIYLIFDGDGSKRTGSLGWDKDKLIKEPSLLPRIYAFQTWNQRTLKKETPLKSQCSRFAVCLLFWSKDSTWQINVSIMNHPVFLIPSFLLSKDVSPNQSLVCLFQYVDSVGIATLIECSRLSVFCRVSSYIQASSDRIKELQRASQTFQGKENKTKDHVKKVDPWLRCVFSQHSFF